MTPEKKEVAKTEPEAEKEEENEDDKLLNELEELTNAVDRKKKQAKKLLAKRRAKVSFHFKSSFLSANLIMFMLRLLGLPNQFLCSRKLHRNKNSLGNTGLV